MQRKKTRSVGKPLLTVDAWQLKRNLAQGKRQKVAVIKVVRDLKEAMKKLNQAVGSLEKTIK